MVKAEKAPKSAQELRPWEWPPEGNIPRDQQQNLIVAVAPGWIFCGRLVHHDAESFTLSPALWVENLEGSWTKAAKDKSKITRSSAVAWLTNQKSALLWKSEASAAVVGKEQLDAIERAE